MSDRRASLVIILAEDRKHDSFVRQYLKNLGYHNKHKIVSNLSPAGRGAGSQFVANKFANEVQNCRARHTHTGTLLIVVLDVDTSSVEDREKLLLDSLASPRGETDPIAVLLPKRNIETWIHALLDNAADEVTDYKFEHRDFNDCHTAADTLYGCRLLNKAAEVSWPPSLVRGYDEIGRLHSS